MKTKRNLSGIYFRSENKDTGKWENTCFEDLTEAEQDRHMLNRGDEWVKSLAKQLADTLNRISEQFDLMSD